MNGVPEYSGKEYIKYQAGKMIAFLLFAIWCSSPIYIMILMSKSEFRSETPIGLTLEKEKEIREKIRYKKYNYSIVCFDDKGKLLINYDNIKIINKNTNSVEFMTRSGKVLYFNGQYILSQDY